MLIAGTVFGIAWIGDQALESISVLPPNWGESHIEILMDIAVAASLPMVAWFTVWFFKKAPDAEAKLAGYRYTPPEKERTRALMARALSLDHHILKLFEGEQLHQHIVRQ